MVSKYLLWLPCCQQTDLQEPTVTKEITTLDHPPVPASGGRMAGDDRRLQILRVAVSLFSHEGFRGTTTKEIAQAAGVSEAMVFRHFANQGGTLYRYSRPQGLFGRCDGSRADGR